MFICKIYVREWILIHVATVATHLVGPTLKATYMYQSPRSLEKNTSEEFYSGHLGLVTKLGHLFILFIY